jgi:aminoglycoside/choline kinase family phosphotransferase
VIFGIVLSAPTKKPKERCVTSTSSPIKTDLLLRETRIRFPDFGKAEVKIAPIEKGGSDRRFYRVHCGLEQTIILVKYNLEREENRLYVQIAEFLTEHRIRVPKIYFHDAAEGLIWLEDLGEADLWSQRDDTWLVRRTLYESALDEIAKLHRLPQSTIDQVRPNLPVEFNAELYRWEQGYFFENCLGRYFGIEENELAELAALPALREIAERLASYPRVLVHRDFQSQNIIVRNGQAYLIDFQGMRPGLAEYDLASLLYDPYVAISAAERSQLLDYYWSARGEDGCRRSTDFAEVFRLCAVQRLMQALGAYGFLGLVKGSKSFLHYISPALISLRAVIGELTGLEKLDRVLARLTASREA